MAKGYFVGISVNTPLISGNRNLVPLQFAERSLKLVQTKLAKRNIIFENRTTFLGNAAIVADVKNHLKSLENIEKTDFLVLYFCGHGQQIKVKNGKKKPFEGAFDETWAFFDKDLLDDEITEILANFKNRPRILVVSDCCFSGGAIDKMPAIIEKKCNIILLSACGENEKSLEYASKPKMTYFTRYFLLELTKLKNDANYQQFFDGIKEQLRKQVGSFKPEMKRIGDPAMTTLFANQYPFTI